MSLHEHAARIFTPLVTGDSGLFRLTTPVRTLKVELSSGQVLGAEGVPELMEGLRELAGMTLSGNLARDLNLALTQGVGYEQAATAAARNLGLVLVRQLGHPMATTEFEPNPPSPGAWPLQTPLAHMIRDALRGSRDAEFVAEQWSHSMERQVVRTELPFEPFLLDPVALRTLGNANGGSLGQLVLHSGRGVPSRTRAAWIAVDLLLHLGLLAVTDGEPVAQPRKPPARPKPEPEPERKAQPQPTPEPEMERPPGHSGRTPEPKRPRLKRRKKKKRPRPERVEATPPDLDIEVEALGAYDDLDLSSLDREGDKVITPEEEAPGYVVEGPPRRSTEDELWYGIKDLTPDDEDEEDPFGLFSSNGSDESLIEPDPIDLTGEFIWAEDDHQHEAWAQRVAEKTVAIPDVTLAELQHLPQRFRTMNPLEVLGLELGDTVTVETVREAYEQRFAQFDPDAWAASGGEARAWAAQARAYVSAAYRKAQSPEDVQKYAARWRSDEPQVTRPLPAYEDEDTSPIEEF